MTFKKGDRVRVKDLDHLSPDYRGMTGTVTDDSDSIFNVTSVIPDPGSKVTNPCTVGTKNLEKLEEKAFTIHINSQNQEITEDCKKLFKDIADIGPGSLCRSNELNMTYNRGALPSEVVLIVRRLREWLNLEVKRNPIDGIPLHSYHLGFPHDPGHWIPPLPKEFSSPAAEEETDSSLPAGYQKSSEGFITNPENWKPGKWLL